MLGIDQGPIILMIENYRTQSVWARFMQNTDILHGMEIATFMFDVLGATAGNPQLRLAQNTPNPFLRETTIRFSLAAPGHVHLALFDLAGRQVATLLDETRPAGDGEVRARCPRSARRRVFLPARDAAGHLRATMRGAEMNSIGRNRCFAPQRPSGAPSMGCA